jgi:alpha-tubulin suppressor-like RCC1 family protein
MKTICLFSCVLLCLGSAVGNHLTAGIGHTCATLSDQTMWCWGSNDYGQLGVGSDTTVPTIDGNFLPIQTILEPPATKIAAGRYHTCAILSDSTLNCWGDNRRGQVGYGATLPKQMTPIRVPDLIVTDIATGGDHACAILSDKTVRCWGDNTYGQIGDGSLVSMQSYPTPVTSLSTIEASTYAMQIAAGGTHTCALTTGGVVQCWGDNRLGQIGDGTIETASTPKTVVGLSIPHQWPYAVKIAAGAYHTCAILSDNTLKCWGDNSMGQLGGGSLASSLIPVGVSQLSDLYSSLYAVQIAAGALHTCAILNDYTVRCWGYNANGQIGDQSTSAYNTYYNVQPTPKEVFGWSIPQQEPYPFHITAGTQHTCIMLSNHAVQCWGLNQYMQLGDSVRQLKSLVPTAVIFPCMAGTFSNAQSSCTPCAAGTYSLTGAISCTPCLAGTYATAGQSSCTPCTIGKKCVPLATCV